MNKTPLVAFVYDRKKKGTPKKEAPVEMRIYYNYKQKWITTGVRLLPRQWQNGVVKNRPDAEALTEVLNNMLAKARTIIAEMMKNNTFDIDEVPKLMTYQEQRTKSFIDYAKERAETRKYSKSEDSQERYDRFLRYFTKWGGIVSFKDVTELNIIKMDKDLSDKGMKNYSKWNNYHRFLNSFIIDAINDGLMKTNPYKKVHIIKDKSKGGINKYLTPEEFRKIESLKPNTGYLRRVKDLFVFQTYTCLSYVDLASFNVDNIKNVKDKKVYVANRGKTKQEFTFLLMKPAVDILEKYDYKLPVISNVKYNQYLKALAVMADIDKPLSSHWARHTGATLFLNEGEMEMEIVSKVLGHSSTKITRQIYAKLLDETVVDAMSKYEEKKKRRKR